MQSVAPNLRRSTRKRRVSVNLDGYIDSDGSEDNDIMVSFHTLFRASLIEPGSMFVVDGMLQKYFEGLSYLVILFSAPSFEVLGAGPRMVL